MKSQSFHGRKGIKDNVKSKYDSEKTDSDTKMYWSFLFRSLKILP